MLALAGNIAVEAADGPLTPAEALLNFETEPGLRVELVAAEPLTADPCALAWDERGRLFVAENRGYPLGGPDGSAEGIVAMLEDTDHDGRIDKRTEFVTGLTFPNGLLPWRGGLIVTCAPDIFFFRDTDGNGKADLKEVILTGFATNLTTQLRANTPALAPDGWVYVASGLSGGKITSPKCPQRPALDLKGDLRFNPDTGEYQATDGKSQFGQSFDEFGRRFGVFNRVQVQHFVLPSHYVARNPYLSFGEVPQNCPELIANPLMRGGGGAARIYPISANLTTADSHAGTFTAACAVHLYRGGGLPAEYQGHAFSCDPTGNLVHHDRLEPNGATFTAKRVRDQIEFLRSRDNWFRPCFLATGPDSALYVADMYRKVIEHPEYLPVEVRKRTDFESGKDLGRIWRVTASHLKSEISNLQSLNAAALVGALDSPNAWQRDTAFRLLVERHHTNLAPTLRKGVVTASTTPAGASLRLHLLALFDGLDDHTLAAGLQSKDAGVRESTLRLAELRLEQSPRLRRLALKLAEDPDARVRFQCALSLGPASSREAVNALARIASRGMEDRWTRAAVLSSVPERESGQLPLLSAILSNHPDESEGSSAFLRELSRMTTSATPAASLQKFLDWLLDQSANAGFVAQAALVDGFADAARKTSSSGPGPLARRFQSPSLETLMRTAREIAVSRNELAARRLNAVQVLSHDEASNACAPLLALLHTNAPPALQLAAIRALANLEGREAVAGLLEPNLWQHLSPACHEAVLSSLLSRPRHHAALLAALECGAVPISALDANRREQLKKSKDEAIRERANELFAATRKGDRMKAFEEAKAALALTPVPSNGREVFKRACANCHRLDGEGYAVGPDLFDIRNQPKESILLHIVVPEYEIAPNFANYVCERADGSVVSGLLVSDTPAGVTLRQGLGLEEKIPRAEIVSLTLSTVSLMPQELEKTMTRQELADLLAYLRGE
jgi:putative membrane-bound dehydrogenase-like protein